MRNTTAYRSEMKNSCEDAIFYINVDETDISLYSGSLQQLLKLGKPFTAYHRPVT